VNNQPQPQTYYARLGVHPSASAIEIRRAYRDLSKKYHPDTTTLPAPIATIEFQSLNEAYKALSNPERRAAYDSTIRYSRLAVVQPLPQFRSIPNRPDKYRPSAYLDAIDRPLSGGEIFAILLLGTIFIGCFILAIAIGIARGELLIDAQIS
jgi:curved DNA-binding protein CbpA